MMPDAPEPDAPPNPHWLDELSRFGPAPEPGPPRTSPFDNPDPVTPPWLSRLHEEWVSPTEFHTLWQPRWKETFAPLYAATPKWQRLWRNGAGHPHQGFFVRGNLLFKVGFYTD
jgi:hypothetical protein